MSKYAIFRENFLFRLKHKTEQQKKRKQNKEETHKEGLGPRVVALWATSPDA